MSIIKKIGAWRKAAVIGALFAALCAGLTPAAAQTTPGSSGTGVFTPGGIESGRGLLYLSAAFSSGTQPIRSGLIWRVMKERAEPDGTHAVVSESAEAAPIVALAPGAYIVHCAYGLASAVKRVTIGGGQPVFERLSITAGALRVVPILGDAPIAANKVSISIFVPERGNSEAKLVVEDATAGEVIRLPEGTYHIVSTYLDTISGPFQAQVAGNTPHQGRATNSTVTADLRVNAGSLTDSTLRHRAATLTLKLVNAPGGEALANTSFTVLTPGGDVIREMIGAFPALVLAEGEYVAIARHEGQTYQQVFQVESAHDRDIEVLATPSSTPSTPG